MINFLDLTPQFWGDDTSILNSSLAAPADNDNVGRWSDLGAGANHMDYQTGNYCTYQTNEQNGRACLRFASSARELKSANQLAIGTFSVFLVAKVTASGLFLEHSPNTNSNNGHYFSSTSANAYSVKRTGGSAIGSGASNWGVLSAWKLYHWSYDGVEVFSTLNGAVKSYQSYTGSGAVTTQVTDYLYLGGRSGGTALITADMGELLIVPSFVTMQQYVAVVSTLARKWGIALTGWPVASAVRGMNGGF